MPRLLSSPIESTDGRDVSMFSPAGNTGLANVVLDLPGA